MGKKMKLNEDLGYASVFLAAISLPLLLLLFCFITGVMVTHTILRNRNLLSIHNIMGLLKCCMIFSCALTFIFAISTSLDDKPAKCVFFMGAIFCFIIVGMSAISLYYLRANVNNLDNKVVLATSLLVSIFSILLSVSLCVLCAYYLKEDLCNNDKGTVNGIKVEEVSKVSPSLLVS